MIKNVGGRSFGNGISFVARKYKIKFEAEEYSNKIKVFLQKNEKPQITKILDYIGKIPFIRGFISICRSSKLMIYIIIQYIVQDVFNVNVPYPEGNMLIVKGAITITTSIITLVILYTMFKNNSGNIWKYHGAEHKVIFTNYENKEINLENCRKAPRVNDRCGSMYVTIFFILMTILNAINTNMEMGICKSILFLIASSLSFELFRLDGKNIPILKLIFKIGYWVQENLVTKEPSDDQLKKAIKTFKILEEAENGELSPEKIEKLLKNHITIQT